MEKRQSIVGHYYKKSARKRLELLFDEYYIFPQKMSMYESNLQMMISAEKAFSRKAKRGNLGVRVQTSEISRITETQAIENVMIENFINGECADEDFLKDTEDADEIMLGVRELRLMKLEYEAFKRSVGSIPDCDKDFYLPYLKKEKDFCTMCDEYGLSADGLKSRIKRIRKSIGFGMEGFMKNYTDDMTISGGNHGRD